MSSKTTRKPAEHLSADSKRFWQEVAESFELEAHDFKRLQVACEAWDSLCEARETVAAEGMFFMDRYDNPRKHPAVAVQEQARIAFLRSIREMGLDIEAGGPELRPPRLGGQRH